LGRYLVEVVEAFGLCPWAQPARVGGEVGVRVGWGAAVSVDDAAALARAALAEPGAAVAMVVLPELAGGRAAIEALRDGVAHAVREAGVAAFGPHGALELTSPAKLVPYLRRSPDPLLQLVPFAILDEARRSAPGLPDRAAIARALAGQAPPPEPSVADRIAARNLATVRRDPAALARALDDLARDRAASYPRAGVRISD
jgi:hypothetical protein